MTAGPTVDARFIDGTRGALFSLHHAPEHMAEDAECFVMVPSFAEEMNRCRYMCTMLAQAISARGYGYVAVDPFGTGDSAGDFAESDWGQWGEDVLTACAHARSLGYSRISLFAIRLGALLAMSAAARVEGLHRLLFWQPVISGKSALTQFLRIRIAASLERDEEGGSVAEFTRQIDDGQLVQVAGYDVSPGVFNGIHAASLEQYLGFNSARIGWLNTLASEGRKTPRADLALMERWREAGAEIDFMTVTGPSYWAVHERTLAPDLVAATADYIAGAA